MTFQVIDRWGNVAFSGAFHACRAWANARAMFAAVRRLPVPWFKISPVR